jgi:hypothetical protein
MAGLRGNTHGVGSDIVGYLKAVALHFKITIVVTSGYRNGADQAQAMFKNWLRLKRGKVYSKRRLPEAQRQQLDNFYQLCKGPSNATEQERADARASFLKLAEDKLGGKSKHCKGRAVDVTQDSIPPAAYHAITMKLKEVREGRNDIYHFECDTFVPRASSVDMQRWDELPELWVPSRQTNRPFLIAGSASCICAC